MISDYRRISCPEIDVQVLLLVTFSIHDCMDPHRQKRLWVTDLSVDDC